MLLEQSSLTEIIYSRNLVLEYLSYPITMPRSERLRKKYKRNYFLLFSMVIVFTISFIMGFRLAYFQ